MAHEMVARLRTFGDSIFEQINEIALKHHAVNLGVGTPDSPPPEVLIAAAAKAMATGYNQYSPIRGEPILREAVAAHAARFYGQEIDPDTEVSITSGVTEALHAAIFSFIEPGDEVIVFEPFYESYVPCIRMAGGKPVAVTLHSPGFHLDAGELEAAFTPRTKALILNSPHNPTGKVLTLSESAMIAGLCHEHDVVAISDEVYEHIVFDGGRHVPLATLPGMRERTLTLGGASKTFSCTGWRIGWATGPAFFHDALSRLRQLTVFSSASPLQVAVAQGLAFADDYFHKLARQYQERRDLLLTCLAGCGLKAIAPVGSFFIMADFSSFLHSDSMSFCRELAAKYGVIPAPTETFYLYPNRGSKLVRFTFCLAIDKLLLAMERLARMGAVQGAVS